MEAILGEKKKYLGEFEQVVIAAVLRLGDEAYGVSIIEFIERNAGRDVSSGALSTTLDRMERKGLIRSELADPCPERGYRPRRYIRVTPAGLNLARESRAAFLELWKGLDGAFEET
jgi:DNA-binding PadR family transcriptional regulator